MDRVDKETRSRIMSRIRSRDTKPEMKVRKFLWGEGYRYRVCDKKLPGKPDLAFKSRRKVVNVHGCFWHGHDCGRYREPGSNSDFWRGKIEANRARDDRNSKALADDGWEEMVVWECELSDWDKTRDKLIKFLKDG